MLVGVSAKLNPFAYLLPFEVADFVVGMSDGSPLDGDVGARAEDLLRAAAQSAAAAVLAQPPVVPAGVGPLGGKKGDHSSHQCDGVFQVPPRSCPA